MSTARRHRPMVRIRVGLSGVILARDDRRAGARFVRMPRNSSAVVLRGGRCVVRGAACLHSGEILQTHSLSRTAAIAWAERWEIENGDDSTPPAAA